MSVFIFFFFFAIDVSDNAQVGERAALVTGIRGQVRSWVR